MNRNILILTVLAALTWAVFGCGESADPNPPEEEFTGTYLVRDLNLVEDLKKEDSVIFATVNNSRYTMIFFSIDANPANVHFCNVEGNMIDFGTPKVTFDPTFVHYCSLDTLRVPRGLFEADFRNHGDTVYVWKEVQSDSLHYDSLYQFKLIKTK